MNNSFREIANIVGSEFITSGKDTPPCYIVNGIVPKAVVFPDTDDQVTEILKICNKESITVSALGGCTKRYMGNVPSPVDLVISTKRFDKIIEHIKDDMIVVAQSGITMNKLQSSLMTYNQFLALDPPHIDRGCTIGGIISTNDYGPLRHRYSSVKESLLAIKFIRADGKVVRSGAKVVKNVAGYDIHKFMAGSYGTLGVITEATLRLYPIPECSNTVIAKLKSVPTAVDIIRKLLNSDFIFSSFEMTSGNCLSDPAPYFIALKIENVEDAVKEQVKQLTDYLHGSGFRDIQILADQPEKDLWKSISDFPFNINNNKLILRIRVPLSNVSDMFMFFEDITNSGNTIIKASSCLGAGIINAVIENNDENLKTAYAKISNEVTLLGGYVTIIESPGSIKGQLDVFGTINGTVLNIMRDIKARFDPMHIMNPGIFIGNL